MCLLNIPVEVRLKIYSKLLVQDDPVRFGADFGPCNPRLSRSGRQGLCPALLRANKTLNREAISFLYSNNRFVFPVAYVSAIADERVVVPYIAPFLRQIGPNANLLRHICIKCPDTFTSGDRSALSEQTIQVLQLIQETCTDLRTIEISDMPLLGWNDNDRDAELLKAFEDGGFKAMSSLEKIVVVIGQYEIDEETVADYEGLMQRVQRMPNLACKWSIELTKLPPMVWISCDDRVEFDTEEECLEYDNEILRMEAEREEEQSWEEYYYNRRNDPYRKNDSDYD